MSGVRLRVGPERAAEVAALHDVATRVGLRGVLTDLNRRGRVVRRPRLLGRAVRWGLRFDAADNRDPRWYPQGVSSDAHASPNLLGGTGEPRRVALVSWYSKTIAEVTHGSRITVVDLATGRYRHVLLVAPEFADDGTLVLKPLRVHAGGIAWLGNRLHVAATGRGFFTADLNDMVRVRAVDAVDAAAALAFDHASGAISSWGYRCLLPVRQQHIGEADDGVGKLRHSFLSPNDAGTELLVGEYGRGSASKRLARFALNPDLTLRTVDGVAEPLRVNGTNRQRLQGVTEVAGRLYATASAGPVFPGTVWHGSTARLRAVHAATPIGPEDLSYDPTGDQLLSVSEHPHLRWLFAMSRSYFD